MIPAETLGSQVRQIQREHYEDGDGGTSAVTAIRSLLQALDTVDQQTLRTLLADFVGRREENVWALALQVIVEERAIDVAPQLFEALKLARRGAEWEDDVVLALLRLGYSQGAPYFLRYIERRLEEVGPLALPLVAALSRVDADSSVSIASNYLVEAHETHSTKTIEPYAATFVRHYLAVNEELLARLVSTIRGRDSHASLWFARCLKEYLEKPWMRKELGSHASELKNQILSAGMDVSN